jgi:hypothetical protein
MHFYVLQQAKARPSAPTLGRISKALRPKANAAQLAEFKRMLLEAEPAEFRAWIEAGDIRGEGGES